MSDRLSFKDFLTVDYTPGMPDLISYRAKKRKTGMVGEEVELQEAKYSVSVEGLPKFYMEGDSPAHIRKQLRSLLRKASSIDSVERVNDAEIRSDLRNRSKTGSVDVEESADLEEALTIAQRRKKAIQFKRIAPRVKIARDRAMRRTADLPKLKKRARKAARKLLFTKLSKGMPKDELSFSRRQEIEQRLDKMKSRIDRLAIKMLPKTRELERERKRPKQDQGQQ